MKYSGYRPNSYTEWRSILSEKLKTASRFELHCWEDETGWFEKAVKFGAEKPSDWSGKIAAGEITKAFCEFLLDLGEPTDKEIYNKFTPFFSIFLDNGFSSEHYGTELNEV